MGAALGYSIVGEEWAQVFALLLLVPAVVLLSRYPFAAVLIWILVFPFFVKTPGSLERYAFYALHRAMIPATLGYVILSHGLGVRRIREPIRLGRPELAMVIFLGLAAANVFLSGSNLERNAIHLFDHVFVPFCAYWLVRLTAPGEEDLNRLLTVAFITVIIQVAIGLLAWYVPQVVPSQWLGRLGARTTGTLGNPAVYSTSLIFLSLLLFQRAMHCRSRKLRLLLLSTFALAIFGVFFTFSRGSWLAGVAVLLGLLLLYPKVTLRLTVMGATLALILGSSLLANEVAQATRRLNADDTAEERVILFNTGLGMVKAKPLFGWGYGTYDQYDNQFKTRVGDIPVRADSTSHNTYLTIMAELGVIGFLFYVFPLAYWLVLSLKAWRWLPQRGFWSRKLLSMLWLAIMAHIIVSNLMDMIRFHSFGTTIWWLTLGLIANMVYPVWKSSDLGAPSREQQPRRYV
jgi:O-antigen ligase